MIYIILAFILLIITLFLVIKIKFKKITKIIIVSIVLISTIPFTIYKTIEFNKINKGINVLDSYELKEELTINNKIGLQFDYQGNVYIQIATDDNHTIIFNNSIDKYKVYKTSFNDNCEVNIKTKELFNIIKEDEYKELIQNRCNYLLENNEEFKNKFMRGEVFLSLTLDISYKKIY